MSGENEINAVERKINEVINDGRHDLVIRHAEDLLRKGMLFSNREAVLSAHYMCAISYYYVGNFKKVLFHIEEHHSQCISYGEKSDWMRSYYLQYFVSSFALDYTRGQKLLEDMLSIALEIEDYSYISRAYSQLSHLHNKIEQYEQALKFAQLAISNAEMKDVDREILLIRAHLYAIESAINLQSSNCAMTSLKYLSQLPTIHNHPREIAILEIFKGRFYDFIGDSKKAFHFYTIAKEQEEKWRDYTLLKEIQQKRIALAEKLCSFDELAIIQKEYIDLLHEIEDSCWVKAAYELQIRLQSSSVKTSENLDYLTGVYNRKYLEETTNLWLADATLTKKSVVCMVYDIDNLKTINDTYGHLIGDEAIKFVAHTSINEIRKEDVLARFGGDEFVLVMQDISLVDAKRKATLLAKKIESMSTTSDMIPIPITISTGLSDNKMRSMQGFNDLFHLADLALYQAKRNGKNQVVSFI
ncbi:hypothetical protein CSV71_11745 [Sporosarcina sp. P21c]|uniref:GGDEF domain-containing protein n=1 Tax=unclassified Sporosarcina TaxID=2647733 RepID=UPI000C16D1C5|nr:MULTISPECIES: GGDEF domain-containing protein [unclassified Sporosarcina]PIC68111.1 hypothetical protein CSV78_04790 [Sporosarcina sp. P16a]PIC89044.1 hypothetical protein CSV71_11745 [Sporosarcina sp. P21c]PIC94420.1 hypothetical protein CSV70_01430 [Sporosarcina sp. P25]